MVRKLKGRRSLARPSRLWKNNIKIDLQEILSEVSDVINLARIGTSCWLFWTRWWIFWFHTEPGLCWLAEEIAGSEEGLCCMEFRQTHFLKYWLCPPVRLPRDRDWIPCRDRKISPQNFRTGYEVHTDFCPLNPGNSYLRLKRPPREAEPYIYRVSTLRMCVLLYLHCEMCLKAQCLRKGLNCFVLNCTLMWLRLWVHSVRIFQLFKLQVHVWNLD